MSRRGICHICGLGADTLWYPASLFPLTRVYVCIHGYIVVCTGIQGYTWVYKGIHGYIGVYVGILVYIRIYVGM